MVEIPREVIKWIQTLDLSYAIKNVKRDLANGFVIAEIFSRYYPRDVNMNGFDNGQRLEKRMDNWSQLAKFFKRQEIDLQKSDWDPVAHSAPESAMNLLLKVYHLLTGRSAAKPIKLSGNQKLPAYAKPTASSLVKDPELQRISDNKKMAETASALIGGHNDSLRNDRADPARFTIRDKRTMLNGTQQSMKRSLAGKRESFDMSQLDAEIKEIKVRTVSQPIVALRQTKQSFATTMKQQQDANTTGGGAGGDGQGNQTGSQGAAGGSASGGNRPGAAGHHSPANLTEFFSDLITDYLEDNSKFFDDDLRKRITSAEVPVQEFFQSLRQFKDEEALNSLLKEVIAKIDFVVERLKKSPGEFSKFMKWNIHAIDVLPVSHSTFMNFVQLLTLVGQRLSEINPDEAQMKFIDFGLGGIAKLLHQNAEKRMYLCHLIYSYGQADAYSRIKLFKPLKDVLQNLNTFVLCLSRLITFEMEYSEDLMDIYLYYALLGLNQPSPIVRAASISILAALAKVNTLGILNLVDQLAKHVYDSWWEVRAQLLVCMANIVSSMDPIQVQQDFVMSEMSSQEVTQSNGSVSPRGSGQVLNSQLSNVSLPGKNDGSVAGEQGEAGSVVGGGEEGEEGMGSEAHNTIKDGVEMVFSIINTIFHEKAPKNVTKIGLVYLAPIFHYNKLLCLRYVEILLSIPEEARTQVLDTTTSPTGNEKPYVSGSNTLSYKLSGAPGEWNSLSVATSLRKIIRKNRLDHLETEHMDVFAATLTQDFKEDELEEWLKIYHQLKDYLYVALCDRDLSLTAIGVLRRFLGCQELQSRIFEASIEVFLITLRLLYRADQDAHCQEYVRDFLSDLFEKGNNDVKEFVFLTLKKFYDKHRDLFRKSNLMPLMNEIVEKRRGALNLDDD